MDTKDWIRIIDKEVFSDVYRNFDLKKKSTIGIGGIAQAFVVPYFSEEFEKLFYIQKDYGFPLIVVGGGSNLVFSSEFLPGCIVSTEKLNRSSWHPKNQGVEVVIEAGYPVKSLIREMIKGNFSGGEFLTGIPGTVGGALAGNAGTQGRGICDLISRVEILEMPVGKKILKKNEIDYGYRYSSLGNGTKIILSCALDLGLSFKTQEVKDRCVSYWKQRSSQPLFSTQSSGCIFKNPPGDSAGRLLDLYKCKGLRCGGAIVSYKHANFIINDEGAGFIDFWTLVEKCRKRVFEASGIFLELEVKIVGV